MTTIGKPFVQHIREELDDDDARANEEFAHPLRDVHFDGPNGEGKAPVVAATDHEAIEQFEDLLADAGADPGAYVVTDVRPDDEDVAEMKDEHELAYSHLHRAPSRQKRDKIRLTITAVRRGEDE